MSDTLTRRINPLTKWLSKKNPKSYDLGFKDYREKKWEDAQKYFEHAIIEQPTHADSNFKLGMCHFRQKNYIQAELYIKNAMTLAPERKEWKKQLEQTQSHLKKIEAKKSNLGKEEDIRRKIDSAPDDAHLYNELAHLLRKQGKWWQEVEALKKAVELKPEFPTWYYRLGEALEVMKRYQQAAEAYGFAISLKKGKAEAQWYYRQGYCFEREGHDGAPNLRAANKAYKEAISKDNKLNAKRFGIGAFHQARGHWPQAQAAYKEQLFLTPWDAELNYRLGMAYDRCYNWAEAAKYYKQAITIDFEKPNWHYRLGFVLEREGDYQNAALAYEYAAKNSEKHTPYWYYRLGYVLEKQERYEEAVSAYLNTHTQQELDTPENNLNSEVTAELTEKVAPPKDSYRQQFIINGLTHLIEKNTTNPELWYQLGNAFEREENWEKAAYYYKCTIERNPNHSTNYYYRLGYALSKKQDHTAACKHLRNSRILQEPYGVGVEKFNKDKGFREAAIYTSYYESQEVEDNMILYESFHGASMSCNPYALFLHALNKNEQKEFKHIWVINDFSKIPDEFKSKKNIIFVKRNSELYLKYLCSCKYLINNNTFPPYFIRKNKQIYLNTWHGTPWKTLGKDMKSNIFEHKNVSRNLLHATHIISPNSHTTKVLINQHDIADIISARVLETGYPRIDLTLDKSITEKLKQRLGIEENKKVILYAPTYRGSTQGTSHVDDEKIIELLQKLEEDSNNLVYFKGHHMTEKLIEDLDLSINHLPKDIDSNELLSIVDVLITDYSSILFDFIPTRKEIILYTYDFEDYKEKRGLYLELSDVPGRICRTAEEVSLQIKNKNNSKSINEFNNYIQKYCPHENGKVSEKVWSILLDKSTPEEKTNRKHNILIYSGALMLNGITVSLKNLLNASNHDKYSFNLAVDPNSITSSEERLEQSSEISQYANIIPRVGRMNLSIEENWLNEHFHSKHNLFNDSMMEMLSSAYKREFLRLYGYSNIDTVINFEGYVRFWVNLFGSPTDNVSNNNIYLHNDMKGEWEERFPNQESVFNLYKNYKSLISVSKSTDIKNKSFLIERFNLDKNKFKYCDNLLNPQETIKKSLVPIDDTSEAEIINNAHPLFINMARLSVEKGHEQLITAFKSVTEKYEQAKLLILGDGPLKESLNSTINKLGLKGKVILLGRKSNPFPYLQKADCFVFSSKHEGQGLVLLESMILNKPIICTNFPCAHDVLENGKYGNIVNNSAEGLAKAMLDFVSKGSEQSKFDSEEYQKNALDMFIKNNLGE